MDQQADMQTNNPNAKVQGLGVQNGQKLRLSNKELCYFYTITMSHKYHISYKHISYTLNL